MKNQIRFGTNLDSLINRLAGKDGIVRLKARTSLVALGQPAVPTLIRALLTSKSDQVRWEAASALGSIGDVKSIPALVKALNDSALDVPWLAAEGLVRFKKAAWPSLLGVLVKEGVDSPSFRQGAHRVFVKQKDPGFADLLPALIKSLEPLAAPKTSILPAHDIVRRLKAQSNVARTKKRILI